MIQITGISKQFQGKMVLEDISMTFERGKTNLIIGASGSGKTVLTKSIVGLHQPDSGEILYSGHSFISATQKERKDIRKQIGMLFQGSALFDFLNVRDNVAFPLKMLTNMTQKDIEDRVAFCLERVNLSGTQHLMPSELSGGMQKRVGIARAIANSPRYLFCDEPNSGLDPQTSILIDDLIHEITVEYNITTIVITHDMNSVMQIGDNVMFIYKGKKYWEGDRNSILDTSNKELVDFVYASRFLKALREK